ncbi:MAG TPA: HDIG domain-containing protein [Candidatus Woesebacteria bacterium]|nr:HDIG domain-containing protein [Candidatus Woesebacteria bacterium]
MNEREINRKTNDMKINNLYDLAGDKNGRGREVVYRHCQEVANYALVLAKLYANKTGIKLDEELIYTGAMVHDIGCLSTKTEKGKAVTHGEDGYWWLKSQEVDEKIARFCLSHVGTGFSREEAIEKGLNSDLNHLPVTTEEIIVAYADKFFSKSGKKHTAEEIEEKMKEYGEESFKRWEEMKGLFECLGI